ncbi:hypothetical protein BN1058_02079 [Paraliobacillus sp. PM-2]|uniref:YicC/YloC family endoribonuclease n=1 Tax=Paraliobacillus sp. PM-2 TaxID=1462524 RepID=UPI00061C6647|nr:YicC/YloC family endoribonuclease [Paraliobacillus sp. PM-2]CQR47752.1 hypothetical protein BN1058_02079 [Paraliobacillus sp. PM-2]
MPNSMTGFGSTLITTQEKTISLEIKTVNHRFLDVSINTPLSLRSYENDIKKIMQKSFKRGRVDCTISLDYKNKNQSDLPINWSLLTQYMNVIQAIQERYHISVNEVLSLMSEIPDIASIDSKGSLDQSLIKRILDAVEITCTKVTEMRLTEGKTIAEDITKRLELIKQIINQLGDRRETVIMEYRDRILDRIFALSNNQFDDQTRFNQEVALLAEKGDITEEITRLHSHVKHFSKTLEEDQAIGKKLAFILQEMQREINTIGAKSNDSIISNWVVTLKTEIEKIKEQIQNIE